MISATLSVTIQVEGSPVISKPVIVEWPSALKMVCDMAYLGVSDDFTEEDLHRLRRAEQAIALKLHDAWQAKEAAKA